MLKRAANWIATEGSPLPHGVSWITELEAYNFSLYSKSAQSVTLLLYSETDLAAPIFTWKFDHMRNKTGRVWHCIVPAKAAPNVRYYAYSVDGSVASSGPFPISFFDPEKILLDPYARTVFFPQSFDRQAAMHPGSNAGRAPLGVIPHEWPNPKAPVKNGIYRHESDAVIYELHVRGFTEHPNSGVAPENRGKYAGVIEKIPYLQELGVTVVELMPVFQFDPSDGTYWGYTPLNFFAPHGGYAHNAANAHREFRDMVNALHTAGIEVVLDVVYNHTCENDERGPIYSYRGIDNPTAYLYSGDPAKPYANYSGTGNTLNFSNYYMRQLVLDSLQYWSREMRVDGFRFDLASVFSRSEDGSLNWDDPPVMGQISSHPDLGGLRLIAEPWDASGGFQLGKTFPGLQWAQWNAAFRDEVRRFVRGDAGMMSSLMSRIYGSEDLFPDDLASAYHPYQSINFVTCHDGFTLYDLVAYNEKHNLANGENNNDGMNENFSWNCDWEGDQDTPPEVAALRLRQAKNLCCLVFLSAGTPMFRAGDEFLQTQGGNNNPYNQDNEISWLDWSRRERFAGFFSFFKKMIAFRKSHPTLCRSRYWRDDIKWHGVGADPDVSYFSRTLAFYLDGASERDADLYVMINSYWQPLEFTVQQGEPQQWKRIIDTSLDDPQDFLEGSGEILHSAKYSLAPRSIVLLIRER